MKKNLLRLTEQTAGLLLAACLLSGCAALLERSYSAVEPYANRYWDSGAEDTLRVENYQDLVTSLLLLIDERAEEGVIRCYGEAGEFRQVMAAREEVRRETSLGSYLLQDLRLSHESGSGYSTVTCYMTYRADAEDIDSLMVLSDTQSLVDLLRLALREDLTRQTARFAYDTSREDVSAAVEGFWQELYLAKLEAEAAAAESSEAPEELSPEEESPDAENSSGEDEPGEDQSGEKETSPSGETPPEESADNPDGETPPEPEEPAVEYPPCPWQIRFYPNQETAEIVEVLLQP